jgi:hypothetical protein
MEKRVRKIKSKIKIYIKAKNLRLTKPLNNLKILKISISMCPICNGFRTRKIRSGRFFNSLNRTVYASPPVGGSASATARSFASLIPTPLLRHILSALQMHAFAYSGGQNVVNSRNVKQNPLRGFCLTPAASGLSYAAPAPRTSHNCDLYAMPPLNARIRAPGQHCV